LSGRPSAIRFGKSGFAMKWRPNAIKPASPFARLRSAVSGLNPPGSDDRSLEHFAQLLRRDRRLGLGDGFVALYARLDEVQVSDNARAWLSAMPLSVPLGARRVIFEHQVTRNAASRLGAHSSRHDNTMAERQPPDLHGREQLPFKRGGHGLILMRRPTRRRRRRRPIQTLLRAIVTAGRP
jgi:hypothetical protein